MKEVNTCVWQWLHERGGERFRLYQSDQGWLLEGKILALHEGDPYDVRYQIHTDLAWRTKSVTIELFTDEKERTLHILVEDGRWTTNGREASTIAGCVDVDLGWTPSTNMLPIRRLNLPVGGDSGVLNAAWVKFPELTLEILPQRYEHLAPELYRYSNDDGNFVAEIQVDVQGVAIEYEGFWRRVETS